MHLKNQHDAPLEFHYVDTENILTAFYPPGSHACVQYRVSNIVTFSIHIYLLSMFILDISVISEGKHREETQTYNVPSLKSPIRLEQEW